MTGNTNSFLISGSPQIQEQRLTTEQIDAFAALPCNAGYLAASRGEPRHFPNGMDDADMLSWLEGYDLFLYFNHP